MASKPFQGIIRSALKNLIQKEFKMRCQMYIGWMGRSEVRANASYIVRLLRTGSQIELQKTKTKPITYNQLKGVKSHESIIQAFRRHRRILPICHDVPHGPTQSVKPDCVCTTGCRGVCLRAFRTENRPGHRPTKRLNQSRNPN